QDAVRHDDPAVQQDVVTILVEQAVARRVKGGQYTVDIVPIDLGAALVQPGGAGSGGQSGRRCVYPVPLRLMPPTRKPCSGCVMTVSEMCCGLSRMTTSS